MTLGGPDSFEASRLVLARTGLRASTELARAIERAVELTARTLKVARVSVWLFDDPGTALHCVSLYELASGTLSGGQTLICAEWPRYVEALNSRKFVAADDALLDPRTSELAANYLLPLGITSMLDAPLFREGRVAGVVCHEHVGPRRAWSGAELDFASSLSDMITAFFEQAERLSLQERLREAEVQKARAERMEALGQLAAGVAHDFNGVLMAALSTAEFVRGDADAPAHLVDRATDLLEVVEVGRRLVAQLLLFARDEPTPAENLDLSAVLGAMRPIFDTIHSARVKLELPTKATFARVDRSRFEQIVLNLVINAADASALGAPVRVRLSEETDARGRWAVLEVIDVGAGIAPEVRERIFDPFFTTRAEGTGMGLATVRAIVEKLGGTIDVTSEVGGGSTFRVRLREI